VNLRFLFAIVALAALYAGRAIGIALFMAAPKTEFTVLAFSAWMGLTYMAVLPPTAGLIGKLYGAQRLATLLGITFMVHQAGAFLGTWLGGVVLERSGSYDTMWLIDIALAGLAVVVSLSVQEHKPRVNLGTRAHMAHTLQAGAVPVGIGGNGAVERAHVG